MDKKWVIFLKEYETEETTFEKGVQIELEGDTADSLINLGFAKVCEAPKVDETVQKTVESFTAKMEEVIQKSLGSAIDGITKKFNDEIKWPATPRDHDLEEMYGFEDEGEFMKAVMDLGNPTIQNKDDRIIKAAAGQNTQDAAEGGVLVPKPMEMRIWEKEATDFEVNVFPMAQKKYTSGQSLLFNRSFETSRANGIRHQGGLGYWRDEAADFTASTLKWSQMELKLHKLTAMYVATEEEIEDASVSMSNVFTDNSSKVIRWKTNKAMFDGTGTGQPEGIMNADALKSISIVAGQTLADTPILHANINAMYYSVLPSSRMRANWYVHPNLEEKLPFIVFNDDASVGNTPVYIPAGGISGRPFGTLLGRPVIPCEFCQDLGTKGDILFADWSQYVSLQKRGRGVRGVSSIHVYFVSAQKAFRFDIRLDARPLWPSAITDLNGSTTRGFASTLNARS